MTSELVIYTVFVVSLALILQYQFVYLQIHIVFDKPLTHVGVHGGDHEQVNLNPMTVQNIQKWLRHACNCMGLQEPTYTLNDMKIIDGVRRYRYRASLVSKSIGKPPVSVGRYGTTEEESREDVAVLMLRRLLSSNGKQIIDYNHYNVQLLEWQLQQSVEHMTELQIQNVTLVEELRTLRLKLV